MDLVECISRGTRLTSRLPEHRTYPSALYSLVFSQGTIRHDLIPYRFSFAALNVLNNRDRFAIVIHYNFNILIILEYLLNVQRFPHYPWLSFRIKTIKVIFRAGCKYFWIFLNASAQRKP